MNIPMFITITKPNYPKYETTTFVCNTLEECQNKLIITLKNLIDKKIDFPVDVDDFESIYWYNEASMSNEFYDYSIFYDGKWSKPWTIQELYETVTNIIHQVDIQNSIYNDKNYYDYCSDEDEKNE